MPSLPSQTQGASSGDGALLFFTVYGMLQRMTLERCSILIVESKRGPFVRRLRQAIERSGAVTAVVREPGEALEHAKEFNLSAALINVEHHALVGSLRCPVLLYGSQLPPVLAPFITTPTRTAAIVSALERLLPVR